MRRRPGFTLIELMIVLGIISILSSIPVVMMPRWQLNARISRAQRVLEATIREARGLAIANRSFTRVRVYTSGSDYLVALSEGKCNVGASTTPCAYVVNVSGCQAGADCATVLRTPIKASPSGDYMGVTIGPTPTLMTFNPWGNYVEAAARNLIVSSNMPGAIQKRWVRVDAMGTVLAR